MDVTSSEILLILGLTVAIFVSLVASRTLTEDHAGDKIQHRVKRVIAGEEAMEGEWPWLIGLEGDASVKTGSWWCFWCKKTWSGKCGGTIIARRWILTAAHCVYHSDRDLQSEIDSKNTLHVKPGEVEWGCDFPSWLRNLWARITGNDGNRCNLHSIKVFRHPRYTHGETTFWNHDVALIKVEADLTIKDNSEIIDLPPSDADKTWPPEDAICHAHGWGCTTTGGAGSVTARNAELPVLSNTECAYSYGRLMDTDTHICAGGQGSSVCSGDSGGPLVCYGKDSNNLYLAGVTSFFSKNSAKTSPNGFARVSEYRQWILDTISNN